MRGSWAIVVLYRSPSIPLPWAFVRLGVSAMLITSIGILMTLAMSVVAAVAATLPLHLAPICVAVLAILFQILDCCDGDVARLTGTVSAFGRPLSRGPLGLYQSGNAEAWIRLYARVINKYNPEIKKISTPAHTPSAMKPASYLVAFVAGLSGVIPLLALSGSYIGAAVFAILAYSLIDLVDAIGAIIKSRDK
jgi:phosphatidylglycerophosphate synthase